MNIPEYLQRSLKKAIAKAGNMRRYAETVGVNYATINRFNSGTQDIGNMPIHTMVRLFPELKLYCFTEDIPLDQLAPPTVGDNEIIEEISGMVKHLPPRDKLKLLTMVAANFGEKIKG